jgi:hypothetical protein
MTDLRERLDRRARRAHADSDALQRVLRGAERRRRHRRMTAMLLAVVIAGAGSVAAYLAVPRGERAPAANDPSPSPRALGEKTVIVDGVRFTISGSSSSQGPCIGVTAAGGSIGGGCGRSDGPFRWGLGSLRANGRLYNIAYGEAPLEASGIEMVMRDGSVLAGDANYGLWLFVLPAIEGDPASDFMIVRAEDATGNIVAQVRLPSLDALRRQT